MHAQISYSHSQIEISANRDRYRQRGTYTERRTDKQTSCSKWRVRPPIYSGRRWRDDDDGGGACMVENCILILYSVVHCSAAVCVRAYMVQYNTKVEDRGIDGRMDGRTDNDQGNGRHSMAMATETETERESGDDNDDDDNHCTPPLEWT